VPGNTSQPSLPRATLLAWRVGWWLLGRFSTDTKRGRKGREFMQTRGAPLIRLNPKNLEQAGVGRVPRTDGVSGGKPRLADGQALEVASVVWATGYRPDFSWIDLPIFGADGYPVHHRGVVAKAPGLYFLGLPFQYTFLSAVVGGVGEDARYVAEQLVQRARVSR
jgi:putative flavoprotein involved in K+ transport